MVVWVLEREVFRDQDADLAGAVEAGGGEAISWSDDWWLTESWPRFVGRSVVFHGSLGNADRIASSVSWSPGAFCSTARFACTAWWPARPELLVADAHVSTTVAELVDQGPPDGFGEHVFVRPDSPLKPFSGRVLGRGEISLETLEHGYYYDDIGLPVIVTPVVDLGAEWRFVVVAGSVVAGSSYEPNGRLGGDPVDQRHPAWTYAAQAASTYDPDPAFVLDVCETPRGLRVLELNPFSGADLYGCDRAAVVDAMHRLLA